MIPKLRNATALIKLEFSIYIAYKLIHKKNQDIHDRCARAKIGKAKVKSQQVPEKIGEKENKTPHCLIFVQNWGNFWTARILIREDRFNLNQNEKKFLAFTITKYAGKILN